MYIEKVMPADSGVFHISANFENTIAGAKHVADANSRAWLSTP
jgi:hypothetical protein